LEPMDGIGISRRASCERRIKPPPRRLRTSSHFQNDNLTRRQRIHAPKPRDVEDLLAERGITVSYESVRRGVNHFGPMIAADLRKRRPKPCSTWHLDEVYLKISGRVVYLWRAVDAEGEVLDVLVRRKRNKHAAMKLMRKLLKKCGFVPDRLINRRFALVCCRRP
jgi:transposase-like protein